MLDLKSRKLNSMFSSDTRRGGRSANFLLLSDSDSGRRARLAVPCTTWVSPNNQFFASNAALPYEVFILPTLRCKVSVHAKSCICAREPVDSARMQMEIVTEEKQTKIPHLGDNRDQQNHSQEAALNPNESQQ